MVLRIVANRKEWAQFREDQCSSHPETSALRVTAAMMRTARFLILPEAMLSPAEEARIKKRRRQLDELIFELRSIIQRAGEDLRGHRLDKLSRAVKAALDLCERAQSLVADIHVVPEIRHKLGVIDKYRAHALGLEHGFGGNVFTGQRSSVSAERARQVLERRRPFSASRVAGRLHRQPTGNDRNEHPPACPIGMPGKISKHRPSSAFTIRNSGQHACMERSRVQKPGVIADPVPCTGGELEATEAVATNKNTRQKFTPQHGHGEELRPRSACAASRRARPMKPSLRQDQAAWSLDVTPHRPHTAGCITPR